MNQGALLPSSPYGARFTWITGGTSHYWQRCCPPFGGAALEYVPERIIVSYRPAPRVSMPPRPSPSVSRGCSSSCQSPGARVLTHQSFAPFLRSARHTCAGSTTLHVCVMPKCVVYTTLGKQSVDKQATPQHNYIGLHRESKKLKPQHIITRWSQQSQECKSPRRHCFCASWPWTVTFWPQSKWVSMQDSWWNISVSRLVILAAAVFETSCG